MYLNKLKIASTKFICNFFISLGMSLWFSTLLMVIFALLKAGEDPVMFLFGGAMVVCFFGGIASAFTFPFAMLKKTIYRAEKYNRIFEEDYDGLVSYETFSRLTGYSELKVKNDISILTRKGIFRNVTFGWQGAMVIMMPETQGDFITVDCPHCGSAISMRVNGGARCEHCGTYLRSE